MPFVEHRGHRIHYTVNGSGPLLLVQHGLLSGGASWHVNGYVEALSDRYTVACVDSLGHGRSDKPTDAAPYALPQRAGDLIAVMDDLGQARAHVLGYSMGGWMAAGVALHHPERLASLIVGGWDLVDGTATATAVGLPTTFDALLEGARGAAPKLVAWVKPEMEAGLRHCWDQLADLDGAAEAVAGLDVPALIWCGADDPYHRTMERFAHDHGLALLSTPGDHLGAVMQSGPAIAGLGAFLDGVGD